MERGAIEGQVFHRGAVLELTDGDTVEPQLNGLVRKELILPERTTYVGDHAFRFRHLLIRDAAYDSLPKETRADLHERFATWLESHARDLIELDEVVGYHLEQSALYRRELGRGDAGTAQRAAVHLAAAGSKAAARSDAGGADKPGVVGGRLRRTTAFRYEVVPGGSHRPAFRRHPDRGPRCTEVLSTAASRRTRPRRLLPRARRRDLFGAPESDAFEGFLSFGARREKESGHRAMSATFPHDLISGGVSRISRPQ